MEATNGPLSKKFKTETNDTKVITETKELAAFRTIRPRLQIAYGVDCTISKLAQHCFSKGLIQEEVYEAVSDTNYESECKRSDYFLMKCYKRAKKLEKSGQFKESKQYRDDLAAIVGSDSSKVLVQTARTIGKYYYYWFINIIYQITHSANFESCAAFKEEIPQITEAIQSNITTIADQALSKNLITQTEYEITTDPSGKHSDRLTAMLFSALDKRFQLCPQDLRDKFIPILINMEDPARLSVDLCKLLLST